MTRGKRIGLMFLAFVMFVFVAIPLFGYVTMQLWNWLMPALFGLHLITFWQALGLIVLTRILFGGFKWGRGMRGRWGNRWEKMTPEQREVFSRAMRDRCAPSQAAPPASPAPTA